MSSTHDDQMSYKMIAIIHTVDALFESSSPLKFFTTYQLNYHETVGFTHTVYNTYEGVSKNIHLPLGSIFQSFRVKVKLIMKLKTKYHCRRSYL